MSFVQCRTDSMLFQDRALLLGVILGRMETWIVKNVYTRYRVQYK